MPTSTRILCVRGVCVLGHVTIKMFHTFLAGELVQEEPVRVMTDGVALSLVRDPARSTLWLVTSTSLHQVSTFEMPHAV